MEFRIKRSLPLLIIFILISCNMTFAQNEEWLNFTSGSKVTSLAEQGDFIWVACGTLTKINKNTEEITIYNQANSPLPGNNVTAVATTKQGFIVADTSKGEIVITDGKKWEVVDRKKSRISYKINVIAVTDESMWIGLEEEIYIDAEGKWAFTSGGLVKFDGSHWSIYTNENSELPYNSVRDIKIDSKGNVWVSVESREQKYKKDNKMALVKIKDEEWKIFNHKDFNGVFNEYEGGLCIDSKDNVWIRADTGSAKLDQQGIWTFYDIQFSFNNC